MKKIKKVRRLASDVSTEEWAKKRKSGWDGKDWEEEIEEEEPEQEPEAVPPAPVEEQPVTGETPPPVTGEPPVAAPQEQTPPPDPSTPPQPPEEEPDTLDGWVKNIVKEEIAAWGQQAAHNVALAMQRQAELFDAKLAHLALEMQHFTHAQKYGETNPDYEESTTKAFMGASPDVIMAIKRAGKDGPPAAHHLAQNRKALEGMDGKSLEEVEALIPQLAKLMKPEVQASKAPEPLVVGVGSVQSMEKDPRAMSTEEYAQWRNKQMIQKRRARLPI